MKCYCGKDMTSPVNIKDIEIGNDAKIIGAGAFEFQRECLECGWSVHDFSPEELDGMIMRDKNFKILMEDMMKRNGIVETALEKERRQLRDNLDYLGCPNPKINQAEFYAWMEKPENKIWKEKVIDWEQRNNKKQ